MPERGVGEVWLGERATGARGIGAAGHVVHGRLFDVGERHRGTIERRIRQFMVLLSEFGLSLNGAKYQLLLSPHWFGPQHIQIAGARVEASECLEVIMGLRMRVGMSTSALLSAARNKFWANKHLLRARTPLFGRLKLMERIAGGSALWCFAAIPPDKSSLGLLNSCQMLLVAWAMRLGNRADETWETFRKRAFRSAKAMLHAAHIERWGTTWLRRWWGYSGHRARSMLRDALPVNAHLDSFRTLEWWQHERRKRDGLQHTHQDHFPKLMNVERTMDRAVGGQWRVTAQNRQTWKTYEQRFVDLLDIPWASGRQTQLMN